MTDSASNQHLREREYLMLLGRMQISPRWGGKVDLSGVIQQTLWEASQATCDDGQNRLSWLRKLLANNLKDEIRKLTAQRRDVRRENSLEAAIDQSSNRLQAWLVQQCSSPGQKIVRSEELGRLACALAELPEDQRAAIELHHLQGQPLSLVSDQIGRTKEATAALLYRAMKRLRQKLDSSEGK